MVAAIKAVKVAMSFKNNWVIKFIAWALLLCAILNACKKLPVEKQTVATFKVLSYNVYEGFGGDAVKIQNFKKWIDTMKPDVIALQEMKGFTKASLKTFAAEMGYSHTLMWHEAGLPVALVSKQPITAVKTVPSNLHLIQAKVLNYHFFVIHLSPLTYDIRKAEMEIILNRVKAIPNNEGILMMGDFNNMSPQDASFYNTTAKMDLLRASEANNPATKVLNNGEIDYTAIQNILNEGFYDSWKMFRSGYEKSAPTKLRTHGNFTRIDYIWLNKALLNDYKNAYLVKDAYTDLMSDHYPMVLLLNQ